MNLMKLVLLSSILFFVTCREENPRDSSRNARTTTEAASKKTTSSLASHKNLDSLMLMLAKLEQRIMQNPSERRLQKAFLQHSLDTSRGGFLVVGMGTADGKSAGHNTLLARKAAEKTSLRWALYAKAWHLNDTIDFGTSITGTISYHKSLTTRTHNDTLYQLTFVPLGSIELH